MKSSRNASSKKTVRTPAPADARPDARPPRQRTPAATTERDEFKLRLLRLAKLQLLRPKLPSRPNVEHVAILRQGATAWNKWRKAFPHVTPNLAHLDIRASSFDDLRGVNLIGANLYKAFADTDLSGADLRSAFLRQANLPAELPRAKLTDASLYMARLKRADLSDATLIGADLRGALLEGTILTNADISGAKIYGISVWDVKTDGLTQNNLVITPPRQPEIIVDSIEMAQFIYLLLQNKNIRQVVDTISQKGVLILGRFTKERKAVLDAIRDRLRTLGFVPMMFDFERPKQRDFTETIKTLAGLSRFIIADITNPKSSPLELQATMPDYMIPFVPIIQDDEEPFSMFRDLKQKYGEWVLDVLEYDTADGLLEVLEPAVVKPALEKAEQLLYKKTEEIRKRGLTFRRITPHDCSN
jgi:hypothetical protein